MNKRIVELIKLINEIEKELKIEKGDWAYFFNNNFTLWDFFVNYKLCSFRNLKTDRIIVINSEGKIVEKVKIDEEQYFEKELKTKIDGFKFVYVIDILSKNEFKKTNYVIKRKKGGMGIVINTKKGKIYNILNGQIIRLKEMFWKHKGK